MPGQARAQLDGVVARNHGQALDQHLGQRGEVPLPFEQVLELGRHLEVARRGLEQRQQIARGARRAARIACHGRGVAQQALAARAVGEPVEDAVVGRQQLVPLLVHGAQYGEPFERPVRGGVELEDSLQQLDDNRRLACVPLFEKDQRALAERREQLRRETGHQHLPIGRRHVVRSDRCRPHGRLRAESGAAIRPGFDGLDGDEPGSCVDDRDDRR